MARRIQDRKKLRTKSAAKDAVKKNDGPRKAKTKVAKVKAPSSKSSAKVTKVSKPRTRKAKVQTRMRVRWCIYDGGMKPVALFDYNQLPAAKLKLAELLEKKPSYFLQLFKDELPQEDVEVTT